MTPERRLNQLEPIVAEIAQKQDRMIGQMRLIADVIGIIRTDVSELKTDGAGIKADVIRIERKADTTAAGLASLTIEVRQGFERVDGWLTKLEGDVSVVKTDVSEIKKTQQIILKLLQERL